MPRALRVGLASKPSRIIPVAWLPDEIHDDPLAVTSPVLAGIIRAEVDDLPEPRIIGWVEVDAMGCDYCLRELSDPKPGQRFCSNGGRCRTRWHYRQRKRALERVDELCIDLANLGQQAIELATETRQAVHQSQEG